MDKNRSRYIQIGLKIAYYRKKHLLTQEQLAEKIGITSKYLSHVETPSRAQPISLEMLFTIADYFNIKPSIFLEFDDE